MGPRESAGKKLSAPTMSTMRMSRNTNMALHVERVPAPAATLFFAAMLPPMTRAATMGTNRTKSIARPRLVLRKGVSQPMPAKAEPLLPPAEA